MKPKISFTSCVLILLLAAALALPAQSASTVHGGSISGRVTDAQGKPQMGVPVEVFTSKFATSNIAQAMLLFTDATGRYSVPHLKPGNYFVKVTAPSFLPALRENVLLHSGAHVVVNLTVNTLFEALSILPPRRTIQDQDDDWKWTLRSAANRPILRVLEDGSVVMASAEGKTNGALKARLALEGGSGGQGFGTSSDMNTNFELESPITSSDRVSVNGSLGYGAGSPSGVLHAAYTRQFDNGSHPEFGITVRRFSASDSPGHGLGHGALAGVVSFSVADGFNLTDNLELSYGGEMHDVHFMGRTKAFRPYGAVDFHPTPNTVVEYRYATFHPDGGMFAGDSETADSGPRISVNDFKPRVENAHHHELSISQRIGRNRVQLAYYSDRVKNLALVGVGEVNPESGEFLADVYSNTFTYNGGRLQSDGLRVVLQRQLTDTITATLDYGMGGALVEPARNLSWENTQASLHSVQRHALAAKLTGHVPGSETRWGASYQWTNRRSLTPVDAFNGSPGRTDPFLNFYIRQPLPPNAFLPGKIEVLIDVRNLLAEGYIPIMGADGHTLYLVQTARSVRGGLAFTF